MTYVDGTGETVDTVAVATAAEAVAAVTGARGVAVPQPASASLSGHPAARFEIAPDARVWFSGVNPARTEGESPKLRRTGSPL